MNVILVLLKATPLFTKLVLSEDSPFDHPASGLISSCIKRMLSILCFLSDSEEGMDGKRPCSTALRDLHSLSLKQRKI